MVDVVRCISDLIVNVKIVTLITPGSFCVNLIIINNNKLLTPIEGQYS